MRLSPSLLLAPAALAHLANAIHFPLTGRRVTSRRPSSAFERRAWEYTSALSDGNDVTYVTNITLGGQSYSVQVDTGSSDLWVVDTNVPNAQNTNKSAKVTYAIGEAAGPILLADMEFAGYNIPEQAFFLVPPGNGRDTGDGLIGLGPGASSQIYSTLGKKLEGSPPVDSIFNMNHSTPNFLTVLLGRSDDPYNKFPGDLSIAEIVPGYENITNQPKLYVDTAKDGNQHWTVTLDANGIFGPDGQAIPLFTQVATTQNKREITAIFDTGYTLPQVPAGLAQAIYSQIEGAQLSNTSVGEAWTMDCTKEVNITFKAGGQMYHINPLDATMEASDLGDDGDYCIGTFQPIADSATSKDYDMILGMAFLRNTYLLVNYGDFIVQDSADNSNLQPYIQLLSTSNDTSLLHNEFVNVRLNGDDTTYNQSLQAINTSGLKAPADSSGQWERIIIIASVVGGLFVLFLIGMLTWCLCKRKARGRY
ncbi:acid protease, partial [Athelia psychrophila]